MVWAVLACGLLAGAGEPPAATRFDLVPGGAQPVPGGLKLVGLPADSPLLRVVRLPDLRPGRLEDGDIIQKVNGKPVSTPAELTAAVQAGGGKPVTLTVLDARTGKPFDCQATPTAGAGPDGPPPAGGPRVHAVLVGDTLDESIGKGCQADLRTVRELLAGGGHVHPSRVGTVTVLDGPRATADGVLRAVAALPSRPQDTVLVYATCHGAFDPAVPDPVSGGHFLALRNRGGRDLPRAEVRKALAARPGRTKLLLTDVCNVPLKIVLPPTYGTPPAATPAPVKKKDDKVVSALERLLFAHAGRLDVTAAAPGEEATGMDPDGGVFTLALTAAMTRPGGWPAVLTKATADARRGVKGRVQTAKVFENTLRPADPPGGLAPLLDPPGERGLPDWWGR